MSESGEQHIPTDRPVGSPVVVVQAHPLDDSYNNALLAAACAGLDQRAAHYRVVRLYAGETVGAGDLAGAGELMIVAPTWWGAMPAIMLDWIQRELGQWIDGDAPAATSPLRSIRRLSVVTSHGSSKFVNTLQGEPGRNLWQRTILPLCADGAEFDWQALYKIDRLDAAARSAFLNEVTRQASRPQPTP